MDDVPDSGFARAHDRAHDHECVWPFPSPVRRVYSASSSVLSKTALMAGVAGGYLNECFEHSEMGRFDITAMRRHPEASGSLVTLSLERFVGHIREGRVIEEARMKELSDESWRYDPGIMLRLDETSVDENGNEMPTLLMVDGHHRALRRWSEGCATMEIWVIPIERAIRPDPATVLSCGPLTELDWGDAVILDGKIVPRHSPSPSLSPSLSPSPPSTSGEGVDGGGDK